MAWTGKGSDDIKRNRPPRVSVQYADPHNGEKMIELPFVMGVMSDLSGNDPRREKASLDEREFEDVTKEGLDDYMASVAPGVVLTVANKLGAEGEKVGVQLGFNRMGDFNPAAIARQVPALRKLLEARQQLDNLRKYLATKPKAQEHLQRLLDDPDLMAALARGDDEPRDGDG